MTVKTLFLLASIFCAHIPALLADEVSALKYGLYIHFGLPTFSNLGEKGEIPVARFAPAALDVKAWARTAKEAGADYIVLTVKHHSGFCLWDSTDYDYDLGASPCKQDIMAEYIESCKAEGVLPGIHYSVMDAFNEGEIRTAGPVPTPYFNVIKKHTTELHTRYPQLRVHTFYGSQRFSAAQFDELRQIIKRLNPQCVTLDFSRDARFGYASAIKGGWMLVPGSQLNPVEALIEKYNQGVAAKKSFLAGVGPDRSGRIPADQVSTLAQLKRYMADPPQARPAPASASKPEATERLKMLKSLLDQKLITKEDYDKKVKDIIDSL